MSGPLVSVVMPVFNGEKYLQEAIESILIQSFKDFEFIIVNDGSTDNSLNIIKSFDDDRIVIINQKNMGLPTALNNGIEKSISQYIARMDADDISLPNRLDLQYQYLEKNRDVVAVGGHVEIIDEDGEYIYTAKQPNTWEEIKNTFPQTPFFHSCVMFRKKQFIQVGGYFNVPIAEDNILFINLAKIGKLINLDSKLIKYRISPQAFSRKSKNTIVLTNRFLSVFYKTGIVDNDLLLSIKKSRISESSKVKLYHYHLLLTKKYLWNNCQPKLARKNIFKSLKLFPYRAEPYLYLLMSFFPKRTITSLYKKFK